MLQLSHSLEACCAAKMKYGWKMLSLRSLKLKISNRLHTIVSYSYSDILHPLRYCSHLVLCGVLYPPGRGDTAHFVKERAKLGAEAPVCPCEQLYLCM